VKALVEGSERLSRGLRTRGAKDAFQSRSFVGTSVSDLYVELLETRGCRTITIKDANYVKIDFLWTPSPFVCLFAKVGYIIALRYCAARIEAVVLLICARLPKEEVGGAGATLERKVRR
jgi:hypothetical protein